ncbi:MAG: DUF2203 domain-containing protein [Actinomycetota bacterium]
MSERAEGEEPRFSVEQANAMLPDLAPALEAMRGARRVVMESAERVKGNVAGNGGGSESEGYRDALDLLRRETERLSTEGVIVRDVESGLVDFPSERDGAPIFLCWRLGEEEVGFWHPPDTGFGGRRPL